MTRDTVFVPGHPGGRTALEVLVADDPAERAAGFQHICPHRVADTAILFRFPNDSRTPFHMRNVQARLDIAFLDGAGMVVDLLRMEPYAESPVFREQPLYRSKAPFRFALETAAGRMRELGITVGTRLEVE